ncbi:MAG: proline dehydrogenase family protein, partial [Gammaproteobacteria bacterium]
VESVEQLRSRIHSQALQDELSLLQQYLSASSLDARIRASISERTAITVKALRDDGVASFLQSFLGEYGLSTEEGVALLSMAEAFLRIPDAETLDDLIFEKVTSANWQSHSGQAASFLVNASTWALMLTGKLLTVGQQQGLVNAMHDLLRRLGEPVVRAAMTQAMERIGDHFVVGTTIKSALRRTQRDGRYQDYAFSFDMLGESAITHDDAEGYFQSYMDALQAVGEAAGQDLVRNSGISVKLSALHPRFELPQQAQCLPPLLAKMTRLCELAAQYRLNLNIAGEEAERMAITLDVFAQLARSDALGDWDGLGIVVQAYARNALSIIHWLNALAEKHQRRFMVRLVKGAYWDTEIKRAQVLGLQSYPVFTQKPYTDSSYLCAAELLLKNSPRLFPQFASHNAH